MKAFSTFAVALLGLVPVLAWAGDTAPALDPLTFQQGVDAPLPPRSQLAEDVCDLVEERRFDRALERAQQCEDPVLCRRLSLGVINELCRQGNASYALNLTRERIERAELKALALLVIARQQPNAEAQESRLEALAAARAIQEAARREQVIALAASLQSTPSSLQANNR